MKFLRSPLRRASSLYFALLMLALVGGAIDAQRSAGASPPARSRPVGLPSALHPTIEIEGLALGAAPCDAFGSSVAALGDFDHDGFEDLVAVAPGGGEGGALWFLFRALLSV